MNAYRIHGHFRMGRRWQKFAVEMVGRDEDDARDHALKDFGSRHHVDRRHIQIEQVEVVPDDEISPITRKRMEKQG